MRQGWKPFSLLFLPVYSGVAQGSVIGALMLEMYTNDLVDLIGAGVFCKLFADDVIRT